MASIPQLADISRLVQCVSCDKPCKNRKYQRRHHRIRLLVQNPVAAALQAKRGQDDALQNVNQQIKHQDRIFVAFIPFEDRQYCCECFTTLSNFLDSLIHLHEDYVSKKSGVPIKLEKSDPESSSDAVQPHDGVSALFDHNDYWDECFKNPDTFFGTDIFPEGNSYHHIDSEHQARTMFEPLASQT